MIHRNYQVDPAQRLAIALRITKRDVSQFNVGSLQSRLACSGPHRPDRLAYGRHFLKEPDQLVQSFETFVQIPLEPSEVEKIGIDPAHPRRSQKDRPDAVAAAERENNGAIKYGLRERQHVVLIFHAPQEEREPLLLVPAELLRHVAVRVAAQVFDAELFQRSPVAVQFRALALDFPQLLPEPLPVRLEQLLVLRQHASVNQKRERGDQAIFPSQPPDADPGKDRVKDGGNDRE